MPYERFASGLKLLSPYAQQTNDFKPWNDDFKPWNNDFTTWNNDFTTWNGNTCEDIVKYA